MQKDLKQCIITTVTDLYYDGNHDKITTALIVREAGISTGALYWHFPSKESIFETIYELYSTDMITAARSCLDAANSVLEQLTMRQMNMLQYQKEHPKESYFVRTYGEDIKRNSSEKQLDKHDYIKTVEDDTTEIIKKGILNGEIVDMPLDFIVFYIRHKGSLLLEFMRLHPAYYEDEEFIQQANYKLLDVIRA